MGRQQAAPGNGRRRIDSIGHFLNSFWPPKAQIFWVEAERWVAPGSRLLPTYRAAILQSGSPPGVDAAAGVDDVEGTRAMQPVLQKKSDLIEKLRDVPHKPGVYLMRDRLNRVIYVGKARDLRKRLGTHFMPSRRTTADLKTRALLDSVWDFEVHVVRNEPEALLWEGKLIKEFRPKYNISFRDDKRFLLVKVNLADVIPRFQLTRLKKDDGCRYFGPFAYAGALRTTLSWMRKKFGIRSCRTPEPGELDYRRCLDHIIKNCSAPCIRRVTLE